ncbi:TraX family protein [Ruficoccus sp. ZRK36]|uniref:TraX family protein n=1 Tax=Ruficoccus sp. ZRK36 TaxID=2866311 RepID=UPI001C739175|nr:TraX family protein [Ruficoccus sp. ZRK36]QYY35173.1 conjugal transfer protein TraX [Ruficoccus sp. ZRK36]
MNDIGKLVACLSMVVDHWTRQHIRYGWGVVLGRLAFPLFAYFVACGVSRTRNARLYVVRLLVLGLVTEPISRFVYGMHSLNVCFTLAAGAALLAVESRKLNLPWLLLSPCALFSDYGASGVLVVWLLGHSRISLAILVLIVSTGMHPYLVIGYAFAASFIATIRTFPSGPRLLPWWVFYSVYPVQFLFVTLI